MDLTTFENLIEVFNSHGGREINITGGEPLLHPKIHALLRACDNARSAVTLSTNGLLLRRILNTPSQFKINTIKISIHSVASDAGSKELLGRGWDYGKVRSNIVHARSLNYNVILNYTLTKQNLQHLPDILKECSALDVDLKIIDLGEIDLRPPHVRDKTRQYFVRNYVDPKGIVPLLDSYATFVGVERDRTGNDIAVFKSASGRTILLKDRNNGKLHTEMCNGCKLRPSCSEGVFALRVNTSGEYMPCLLRADLAMTSSRRHDALVGYDDIEELMSSCVERMVS